ncbi:LysM peptidoglycan-binding domain-containing protein [Clostridium sp. P21]|uniref:LysM peptidoglycan-binding domain-containing protein n=1 Tax=Clostridium muellerianum TaxID=2716538 RepID=A0A7Y0EI21_9CLOT|nr:peptidoglycan-binding protein [Clostridium muellerianum]NMM62800.1 LysM peptidoglycan-binding domain-containing protein [Clostridium muellerianum]
MNKKLIVTLTTAFLLLPLTNIHAQITQPLYYYSVGNQVSELQTDLKTLNYYNGNIDGNYAYSTYLAVKNFQTNNNLTADGGLNLTTLSKLNKALSGEPPVLSYGIRHDRVSELQTYLNALGYLSVSPTGYYGSLTQTAVSNFQKDNQLPITGTANSTLFSKIAQIIDSKYIPTKSYSTYTVKSGDNSWNISIKFGITQNDLLKENNLTTSSILTVGQVLKIPKINVPVKPIYGKFGEDLEWFTEAQYVFPIGASGTLTDFFNGIKFNVKRTIGAGHADSETLTAQDTASMKQAFGGSWTWNVRPMILETNGRKIAVSVAGMPHAGLDAYPSDVSIANRSGNYGTGPNLDYVKGNDMNGHFDIHFLGSLRHKDWQIDPNHQAMINISANR